MPAPTCRSTRLDWRSMATTLLDAGGFRGMVGGQWLDLAAEGRDLDAGQLATIHRGKTGALIRACCELGGIAAGAGPGQMAALTAFGHDVGLAFQVADDVLDATGSSEALGKTAGRDAMLAKSTYVSRAGGGAGPRRGGAAGGAGRGAAPTHGIGGGPARRTSRALLLRERTGTERQSLQRRAIIAELSSRRR